MDKCKIEPQAAMPGAYFADHIQRDALSAQYLNRGYSPVNAPSNGKMYSIKELREGIMNAIETYRDSHCDEIANAFCRTELLSKIYKSFKKNKAALQKSSGQQVSDSNKTIKKNAGLIINAQSEMELMIQKLNSIAATISKPRTKQSLWSLRTSLLALLASEKTTGLLSFCNNNSPTILLFINLTSQELANFLAFVTKNRNAIAKSDQWINAGNKILANTPEFKETVSTVSKNHDQKYIGNEGEKIVYKKLKSMPQISDNFNIHHINSEKESGAHYDIYLEHKKNPDTSVYIEVKSSKKKSINPSEHFLSTAQLRFAGEQDTVPYIVAFVLNLAKTPKIHYFSICDETSINKIVK